AEHSLELQLPFLAELFLNSPKRRHLPPATIVPILVGQVNARSEALYGQLLAPFLQRKGTLFVVSSDFCHWGAQFGYTRVGSPSLAKTYRDGPHPDNARIEGLDREGMDYIQRQDAAAFRAYLRREGNTICGRHPILVLLEILAARESRAEMSVNFVKYAQSRQCAGQCWWAVAEVASKGLPLPSVVPLLEHLRAFAGVVGTPAASPQLNIPSRCYIVLEGMSLEDLPLYPPTQQLYVFDHQVPDRDGAVEALAIVLLKPRSPASPELVPEPATALSLALAWIQDLSVEALDRVTFYSDEAPQAVPAKKPRPRLHFSRADMEAPALPSGTAAAEPAPKPKKPSVAGLAAQMETLMGILPGLSARIDGMDQRTLEIANLVTTGAAAPLRRPLAEGLGATTKAQPPTLAMLGPPPAARASAQRPLTATEDEALEAADVEQDPQPLDVMAQAILAQSKALTSLVQQLASAHADPVLDLGGVGSASARGGVAKPRPPDGSLADLEQTFLDGARMEIGFQLTWLEEPPSSLYLPRLHGITISFDDFAAALPCPILLPAPYLYLRPTMVKEGPLWLPFLDPCILRHGYAVAEQDLPDLLAESRDGTLDLALLWDVNGLLDLRPPLPAKAAFARSCRIFNSYKSKEVDRQIGDRRPANRSEYHLGGPSAYLPQGHLLTAFSLRRFREKLCGYASDRKDFYHQVKASAARSDANRLPFSYPAVVIDDLVNISALPPKADPLVSFAGAMHARALDAYAAEDLMGSPDKDVVGATLFKAIGAEIDSRAFQVARGCVPIGAPLSRCVPLAALSLRAARLPWTTPCLLTRLSGAWVSVTLFRRCAMALFGRIFGAEPRALPLSAANLATPQPRALAQELCLAVTLMPLLASNVTAPFHLRVYATDASLGLGAICSTPVTPALAKSLWLHGDRRGGYSLETGAAALLSAVGEVGLAHAPVSAELRSLGFTVGLESLVCNDLLCAATWSVEAVMRRKGHHHINVLELSTFGALLRRVAREAPDSRITTLLDSVVAKAAAAKGRSTSFALTPALAKACSVQLAYGLYTAFGFAPTRLNTADPPSRGRALDPPSGVPLSSCLPPEAVHGLGELRLRRGLSSWARLVLAVTLARAPPSKLLCDVLAGRHSALPAPYVPDCHRDFDACLGYPGEGPGLAFCWARLSPLLFSLSPLAHCGARALTFRPFLWGPLLSFPCHSIPHLACLWISISADLPADPLLRPVFDSSLGFPGEGWFCWVFLSLWFSGFRVGRAMDLSAPRTPADARRAELRRPLQIVADRVIRPVTRANRARLLEDFDGWLRTTQNTNLAELLKTPWEQVEQISAFLVQFGQQLFRTGSPYYRYSETINGVAAARSEEVLAATRKDLILPRDAAQDTTFALLQIRAPKTRGRAAKHQASHVDPPDVVELLDLAFGALPQNSRLWPMSAGTLRRRFKLLQARFGLTGSDGAAHFELSSFRPLDEYARHGNLSTGCFFSKGWDPSRLFSGRLLLFKGLGSLARESVVDSYKILFGFLRRPTTTLQKPEGKVQLIMLVIVSMDTANNNFAEARRKNAADHA
ncbi:Protein MEMO1, partial [Symbiodinium microadriaticum]